MNDPDRVVVIGSGPCGAVAAARLIERGVPVTMLDAGFHAPPGWIVRAGGNTIFRKMDDKEIESGRHDRSVQPPVDWHSSRTHGGLSNYWTAAVPRFAPEDFTEGGALDERYVWPITYDDLVPYYETAEQMLVVTSGQPLANVPSNAARYSTSPPKDWQALIDRAATNGDHLAPIPMAKGRPWMVARRGTEFSSYHCVIEPLLQSPLFTLVSGAQVTRLNHSSAAGGVDSVDYVDRRSGGRHSMPARAVVVAAGAIDSTCILLRSVSADFPRGLGNTAGLVGRYLHDHPREWWTASPATKMTALAHPIYVSRGPFDPSKPLLATSLTIGLASAWDRPRTYVHRKVGTFGVQVFGTMVPTPDVGVSLPDDLDPGSAECHPRISLAYDQAAIDNIEHSRQRLIDVFAGAGLDVAVPGPFHPLTPGSSVHYGGSVRMHASPEFGVLDRWNRIHDAPNVVVCDSSCFTTGPEKNPTLTAMAIAGRAADHLADEVLGTGR